MSLTVGIHHVGLAVSNLEESANFFKEILGWREVKRLYDYPAIFLKDEFTMITLWKTKIDEPIQFNRKNNIGLHHLAIQVKSNEALFHILDILNKNQIEIEFSPTLIREGPAMHMMCYEPSGIRIEFYSMG
ncbi:VOC family protein [Vibrio cholerae]